ncbi:hypothetical protein G6556_08330 [Cellulomonas sp. IC4_254]|nr:hypothetical protein [Cellulomonas sp. IC4_254]
MSHDERTQVLHELLAAEAEAGVGAAEWGADGTLIVRVHDDRVTESRTALAERLTATYGVAVDVRGGAPVRAEP